MTPDDVSSRSKLKANVEDQAGVQALVCLLERKGLVDKADLETFYRDMMDARERLVDISSVVGVILGVVLEGAKKEELDEALAEFCNGLPLEGAIDKARQALDCVYMAPEAKAQIRTILDSMAASTGNSSP